MNILADGCVTNHVDSGLSCKPLYTSDIFMCTVYLLLQVGKPADIFAVRPCQNLLNDTNLLQLGKLRSHSDKEVCLESCSPFVQFDCLVEGRLSSVAARLS